MSETSTFTPSLSCGFIRARNLSRFVAVLFTLGCLVMLSTSLAAVVFVFVPKTPAGVGLGIGFPNGISVDFGALHGWATVGAMVAVELITVPVVLVLNRMRKLFLCFAKGEVFAAQPIANVRAAGFWLTLSFFTGIAAVYLLVLCGVTSGFLRVIHLHFLGTLPGIAIRFESALFVGIPTIIAAYVMEEARRIASDNAGIV
jgi:hypothetical protein